MTAMGTKVLFSAAEENSDPEEKLWISDGSPEGTTMVKDVITAFEIARHGLIIETGRVSKTGTTEALSGDPTIRHAYLGM